MFAFIMHWLGALDARLCADTGWEPVGPSAHRHSRIGRRGEIYAEPSCENRRGLVRGERRSDCTVMVKDKKAELAGFAAREVAGTGWLPEVMRLRDERSALVDEAA